VSVNTEHLATDIFGVSGTMVIHTQVNDGLSWYDICETVV